jgi:hypothetical protein
MEQETKTENKKNAFLPISLLLSAMVLGGAMFYTPSEKPAINQVKIGQNTVINLEERVLPSNGFVIPVEWKDLGDQMVKAGVIDADKFEALYILNGEPNKEVSRLLHGAENGKLTINSENSKIILNLFWALGLGNKNSILENGPMQDKQYGGAGNFASTGGWTLANGDAMNHYSMHAFITLTKEQQDLVERVSKGIYRPCCGNSTYFPDCNHGMAMLGLLELMASQGASEEEMYKVALQVNAYWFPDTYITIAKYLESKGITWEKADAKEILGAEFSSGSGYKKILSIVNPPKTKSSGGCGVE